jgi:hypothetical protein
MPTLHIIHSLSDPLLALLADDPVRPEIPAEFRVSPSSNVYVLLDDSSKPQAVVCAAYRGMIPSTVMELVLPPEEPPTVAVFYTIWSYVPGTGRRLIASARASIQESHPEIRKFVTLSPPTDMARVFHLRNGAEVFRVNSDSVNYLYP